MDIEKADMEKCALMREEEWQVLEAIYPEYLLKLQSDEEEVVKLTVPVELGEGQPKEVTLYDPDAPDNDSTPPATISLLTLPPILLSLRLPHGYPVYNPPVITTIQAALPWITKQHLDRLQCVLVDLWEEQNEIQGEGRGILYDWIEMLRSAAFLENLGFVRGGTLSIAHTNAAALSSRLVNFDKKVRAVKFSQNAYTCEICLSSVKGVKCILLRCEHVFCRGCLFDFWQLCVTEGDVGRVGCPDPKCVKDGNLADEEDVRIVLQSELQVQRWKLLKAKKEIEKDPTIVHCLMAFCQAPIKKPEADPESGWAKLRICLSCGYSFCSECRKTWHGAHEHCPISSTAETLEQYLALPENSPGRKALEHRHGKTTIEKLVKNHQRTEATMRLLDSTAQKCPGCQVYTEKDCGCNHMHCPRCDTHFCYLCGEETSKVHQYRHWNLGRGNCVGRLWEDHEDLRMRF